jgi:hypothetical protein
MVGTAGMLTVVGIVAIMTTACIIHHFPSEKLFKRDVLMFMSPERYLLKANMCRRRIALHAVKLGCQERVGENTQRRARIGSMSTLRREPK